MAILESVKELASKLGAETNGRDITDQLNKINKHLDEAALGGRDIAEAVKTYSKNASGGGGETFEVEMTFTVDSTHPDVLNVEVDKTFSETISAIDNGYIINFNITRINGQQTTKSIVYGYKKFLAGDIPFINIMAGSSDGGTGFIVVWVNDSTTAISGNPMDSVVIGTPET